MRLRLAYLAVTNTFAMRRMLPMSDRDKDIEILALRHQITALERQLGQERVHFAPADRAFLPALPHSLPRNVQRRLRLLVRPDTVLRWHHDLIARRHAALSKPKALRLAKENPNWRYRRLHGELLTLNVTVAASPVWESSRMGIDPAPERNSRPT
ncbi:hypothetical protein [Saccharopolyspora elongata]|uniref:hypothetical protein n=1 Tax=Saccharopolyspora elongata TaxID=2530387 RepID=UPI001F287530|nr:hypothetical protein [Saccharopolyspora elongata]